MYAKLLFLSIASTITLQAGERTVPLHKFPTLEPGKTSEDKAMELRKKRCLPCEGKVKPLSQEEEDEYAQATPQWSINRAGTHTLIRKFVLRSFKESMGFVNAIADLAEEESHHPAIEIFFNVVSITLYTHAIGGLSENDFIVAARIDELAHKKRLGGKR